MRALLLAACAGAFAAPATASDLWDRFQSPPADARPMLRWWWFGPAVTDAEIDREIRAMKAGGFGGFEVQPTYPLTPDDPQAGRVNIPFLSKDFVARLAHAGETARAEKMRIDVTIGTGWPFGGAHVPVTEAAALIRKVDLPVAAGRDRIVLPPLPAGETYLAAFLSGRRVLIADGAVAVTPPAGGRTLTVFVAGRTGQQVKRAAVGGEGFVIDHVDAAAVTHHLRVVGDRLLDAFPKSAPPYAMFSDSLEAYGSSWTGDLPAEFRKRRGYELLDHLPALFDTGAESAGVRHDWALTLSELVDERYLTPIDAWAKAHGTRFRAQVYGFPPPRLSSNALVALPEGEGAPWRRFTSTRWATSAAHLYGKPVVSSETWTWLHSPSWAATPLDMKVEADRHFLQGVNQLIGHGWPYSAPGLAEPGWAFYAASALNDHNPWYVAMPAVTRYLTRASAMLREGAPADQVAIYLPTEDAFAALTPADASVDKAMARYLPEDMIAPVLDAGFGFDFVDAQAVTAGKLTARILILPALERIDAAAYAAIAHWKAKGGIVIAIDHAPNLSGGLIDGAEATRRVHAIGSGIFAGGGRIVARGALAAALRAAATPDVALTKADPRIGFVHRKLDGGDLYFVANTSETAIETRARFIGDNQRGAWWDAETGRRWASGTGDIPIRLAPYESRFLLFEKDADALPAEPVHAERIVADLSRDWSLTLGGQAAGKPGAAALWTQGGANQSFSGSGVYRRTIMLGALPAGRLSLDFGKGVPTAAEPDGRADRPRAMLAPPVREAAIVTINGKPAGTLWAPPYRLDVTGLLKPGANQIAVTVMNGALNALAARGPVDQQVLSLRYGERFTDQDQKLVVSQPSGLTGPITLVAD
ncbi:glycosyl hydrolase [Sphingomonas sp. BIUV-7]|uniref:Glycosyl hydrolase n=2 Tax=Sphingomonas natans TaxID=3063330 RepID=A0ABT8Y4N6_9SPHN|nr:glycosyl hydrolase [Sphingomonas sp. BIUV-7]